MTAVAIPSPRALSKFMHTCKTTSRPSLKWPIFSTVAIAVLLSFATQVDADSGSGATFIFSKAGITDRSRNILINIEQPLSRSRVVEMFSGQGYEVKISDSTEEDQNPTFIERNGKLLLVIQHEIINGSEGMFKNTDQILSITGWDQSADQEGNEVGMPMVKALKRNTANCILKGEGTEYWCDGHKKGRVKFIMIDDGDCIESVSAKAEFEQLTFKDCAKLSGFGLEANQ